MFKIESKFIKYKKNLKLFFDSEIIGSENVTTNCLYEEENTWDQ